MEAAWNAMVVALVPILATFAVWLLKRLIDLAVSKIGCLSEEKKARIRQAVVTFAQMAATKTAQTYADARKEASKDGKLTAAEKQEAFRQAKNLLMSMLKDEGVDVLKDVGSAALDSTLEFFARELSISRAEKLADTAGNA